MSGTDAERVLKCAFNPPALQIPPVRWESAYARLTAPRPGAGTEVARQFTITAAGGGRAAQASGSIVQECSVRRDIRPVLRPVLRLPLGRAIVVYVSCVLAFIGGLLTER